MPAGEGQDGGDNPEVREGDSMEGGRDGGEGVISPQLSLSREEECRQRVRQLKKELIRQKREEEEKIMVRPLARARTVNHGRKVTL